MALGKMSKCEICNENLSKYKCPGCLKKTCSLVCVNRHKELTLCDGKRNKTAFIKMKEFNDRHLLNDYRLLEESHRRVDSTHRDQLKRRSNRPNFLQTLIKEARKRGVNLKTMPYPMEKRKSNSTCYRHKDRMIMWQVEWVFQQADVKYTGKRLSETSTMSELLDQYISPGVSDPVILHALRIYCKAGKEACRLFLKVVDRPANNERYYELSMNKTLQENLKGKAIVEYPTVFVVLKDRCSNFKVLETTEVADEEESSCSDISDTNDAPLETNTCEIQIKLSGDKDSVTMDILPTNCEETNQMDFSNEIKLLGECVK